MRTAPKPQIKKKASSKKEKSANDPNHHENQLI